VHPANEPLLIEGVGTYALELLEQQPDIDAVVVPIGGGSGVGGVLTAASRHHKKIEVFAVQASAAPAFYKSWKSGRMVSTETANTMADGIATRFVFEVPFSYIPKQLTDMVLVDEAAIEAAIRLLWRTSHNMAEGAGATPLAAMHQLAPRLQGKKVALIVSGGNLDSATIARVFSQ
jgi:threonine dehydratase